jgi:acyl-CoA synthetase (AMP-forming)/AMP-acid ligase II
MNVADYLLECGKDQQIALVADRSHHTYLDIRKAAATLARGILEAGIQPGDAVGLLASNSLFWIASYLSILKLGCIAVPFNPASMPAELSVLADFTGCKTMCLQRRYLRRFAEALPSSLPLISDDIPDYSDQDMAVWNSLPDLESEEQDAALMLTSGTTSSPRVVRVTHKNIKANTDSIIACLELTDTERIMVVLPFYYCFGTSLLHTHLRVGGSLVLCNSFVYPQTALDLMEAENCTGFAGVPSMYQTLIRDSAFPKREFPHLRKIQQAGGKLPPILIQELMECRPNAQIYIMYGQTEATARLSILAPELLRSKLGSVGRGIPGTELRVVSESGQAVAPGEVGEIIARGDNVSPGYLNNPEATSAKFVDGMLHTRDLATVDADGFIYIVDRTSDFIKSHGYRVSSQQVEETILQLTDLVAAAVIGEPDLAAGEAIIAYVVIRKGSPVSPEDVLAHCRQNLPRYMWPKEVIIVDSLPKSAQGKIVKSVLRERHRAELTRAE